MACPPSSAFGTLSRQREKEKHQPRGSTICRLSLAGRYSTAVCPIRCTSTASVRAASSAIRASRASRSSAATFTLMSSWCSSAPSTSAASASVTPLPPTCSIALRSWAWPRRKRIWALERATGMRCGTGDGAGRVSCGHRRPAPRRVAHSHPDPPRQAGRGTKRMATRSKSSQRWLKEHFSDPYVKKAQAEGLRSRAAYKLEELVERDRLLRPGMVVVDLGAAPGGWSQWVRQALGDSGRVLALDILDMPPLAGVEFLHGDFREDGVLSALESALN